MSDSFESSLVEVEHTPHPEEQVLIDRFIRQSPHGRPTKGIVPFLREVSQFHTWDRDLVDGVGRRFHENWKRGLMTDLDAPTVVVESTRLLDGIHDLMQCTPAFKASSFNYLHTGSAEEFVDQSLANAQFWTDLLGADFFERSAPGRRANVYRSRIANKGFYLTVKPGGGAGTFSLDFAISYSKFNDGRDYTGAPHELWRLGIDTELTEEGTAARIIRSGSGVKSTDEVKSAAYERFKKDFASSPQRLLTFTALYFLYGIGADTAKALSTKGATRLSSLGRSKGQFDYSHFHQAIGFRETPEESHPPLWLTMEDIQSHFPHQISQPGNRGMQPHEPAIVDTFIDAFNSMHNQEGEPFKLEIMPSSSAPPVRLVNELAALLRLQGYPETHTNGAPRSDT